MFFRAKKAFNKLKKEVCEEGGDKEPDDISKAIEAQVQTILTS